jgi:hypothetical protein
MALEARLGTDYKVTAPDSGSQDDLKVHHSAASLATVHLEHAEGMTKFHVHGGGLVVSRLVNELGIAKKVSSALEQAFGSTS